jgi:maleate isomerase
MLTPHPSFPAIDYGSRLRAGVLIPSGNSAAEPELRAMLPPQASIGMLFDGDEMS